MQVKGPEAVAEVIERAIDGRGWWGQVPNANWEEEA